MREFVPVQAHARQVLEDLLAADTKKSGPVFTTRTGQRLTRHQLFLILQRMAAQANAHRRASEHIQVSQHVLRHTFLRKLAESRGVQYAKEASGHRSDGDIWRYVQPDRQSLADAIDAMERVPQNIAPLLSPLRERRLDRLMMVTAFSPPAPTRARRTTR